MERILTRPLFTPSTEAMRFLPEGPHQLSSTFWPEAGHFLGWVSIQHGSQERFGCMNILNLDTGVNTSHRLPGRPGFWAESNRPGVFFIGMEREVVLLDSTLEDAQLIRTGMRIIPDDRTVINDGIATPFGALFGTKDYHFEKACAHVYLYRNGERSITPIIENQTCSNGKIIFGEETEEWRFLDIDTPTKRVVQYTLEPATGKVGQPVTVVDFSAEAHFPDGMRLTPDGQSIVVSFYNPNDRAEGITRQINLASGKYEYEWITPGAARATCPAFIQIDGAIKIVITTAVEGMPSEQREKQPHAGCLFIGDTPFKGPLQEPHRVHIDALLQ